MASAPLWNQTYDRNHTGLSEIDGFLNGATTWNQEGGDTGTDTTSPLNLNGVHHDSDSESRPDQVSGTSQKMAAIMLDETSHTVGDSTFSTSGLRPLKSRPEDRIASITDNPFYKSFGVRHPRSPRDVPSNPSGAKMSVNSDSKYGLREELGEYKPGSGFVNKLRGRFASLGIRDDPPSLHHIKHASSFDDILDGTESQPSETENQQLNRGRLSKSSNLQHRARSVESLGRRKAPPPQPIRLRHVERKWERPTSPTKSPREVHIVAPDVKLARDDIILIENPPSESVEPEREAEDGEEVDNKGTVNISSLKGEMPTNELPKPNTVSTVRSLFESGKPLSPTSVQNAELFSEDGEPIFTPRDSVYTQRESSLTPRDTVVTPRDSVLTPRDTVLTPRETVLTPRDKVLTPRESPLTVITPRETISTPRESVLSPRDSNITPRESKPSQPPSPRVSADFSQRSYDASRSRFFWKSDVKTAGGVDTSSSSAVPPPLPSSLPPLLNTAVSSTAETKATDSEISETAKPSLFQVTSGVENRPPASPRSTAAVKAVPASRPMIPSRPSRPNNTSVSGSGASVPPSFTPSIKKTSPVMPVAPFKETKTEEEDEYRHLIYEKKASSKSRRPARVKNYDEVGVDAQADTTKRLKEEVTKEDSDVQKTNKVNLAHTKGRAPPIPKQRRSEESPVQSPRVVETDDNPWTSPHIEDSHLEPVTLVPVEPPKPVKAPRNFFPKVELEDKAEKNETVSLSPPEETNMQTDEVQKEERSADTVKSEEPVRGIPSIIANRLKQNGQKQNVDSEQSRPGELFGVRLGKTRHEDDSAEVANEIPRKRLAHAEKPAKDTASNLPTEIENQIASVRKRMEVGKNKKSTGVSQIFDSSQLRKKKQERQAAKSNAQAGVPRLDLSSITSEDTTDAGSTGGYRVTPREIKPCKIEFVGANVSTGRSLLHKQRKTKINIRFHDVLIQTFEYPSEETMLEEYMKEHPDEEVLVLEEVSGPTESSDDIDIPDTPRGGGSHDGELLKANTSLAHSGTLQSYRGKFQLEYELGSVLTEPEKPETPAVEVENVDPDSMQLRPAEEDDSQLYSVDTSSDLLF